MSLLVPYGKAMVGVGGILQCQFLRLVCMSQCWVYIPGPAIVDTIMSGYMYTVVDSVTDK